MTTLQQTPAAGVTPRAQRKGSILAYWLSSTDHKIIGHLYLITSFFFFLCAGVMALLMRIQLLGPDQHFVSDQQYNELFTMHGTIMLLLFATPLFIGFSNELIPLQIGAPDVAFPRLNLLSYYLFAFGGLILLASFLTPGGAAAFGWYGYSPLTSAIYSPGVGGDMWIMGLVLSGLGTILGAVNFITTIFCMRAPGMTMFRMPIFTWNALLTSMLALMAFPVLAAALLVLEIDRRMGAHVFDAASGGAILWQNLFWFFGHPEVYILAIPFFGIATEIIPVFSRKPLFGYKGMIAATIAIAGLSMTVWAHHMFTTGAVLLPFFSLMSFFIAIPTGIKFFNWTGTMWRGQLTFEPPMLYSVGFLVTFLFGGITGVLLASPPLDFAVSDSYFVVAHFHYVLAGTVLFAMFAGFYFWWPKMTGKMLNSRIGKIQFWFMFIGFQMTFLVQHWIGVEGMPRRVANYPLLPGNVTTLNVISSVGSWILALSVLMFFWNMYVTWRHGETVTEEDPWGYCSSLEWATSCPPPRHNFYRIPRIRSERPAFEAHYPHIKWGRESHGIEQTIPPISNGEPKPELQRTLTVSREASGPLAGGELDPCQLPRPPQFRGRQPAFGKAVPPAEAADHRGDDLLPRQAGLPAQRINALDRARDALAGQRLPPGPQHAQHLLRVDVVGHRHVVQHPACRSLLRGAADLAPAGGDVVERLIPGGQAQIPGQRGDHPVVEERVGVGEGHACDQRFRRVQRVGDGIFRLDEHRAAAADPAHHGDPEAAGLAGIDLVAQRLEAADDHGGRRPLPDPQRRRAPPGRDLAQEYLVDRHVQHRVLRAFADELPVVIAPVAGPEDRAAHGDGHRARTDPGGHRLAAERRPDARGDRRGVRAHREPGHRGAEPLEHAAGSREEAVADPDADQAAACHLDVRRYELAAGRLVLTVHAYPRWPFRQSARRWRARSAPATSPAQPQHSPR